MASGGEQAPPGATVVAEALAASAGAGAAHPSGPPPPLAPGSTASTTVLAHKVTFESWCVKESKWLRIRRRRWIVLTPFQLATYRSRKGYLNGQRPTERFALSTLGAVIADEDQGTVHINARERPLVLWFDPSDVAEAPAPSVSLSSTLLAAATPAASRSLSRSVSPSGSDRSIGHGNVAEHYACLCALGPGAVPLCHQWATRIVDSRLTCEPSGVVRCAERFQLGDVLGAGAYATVYRACCLTSGRACAVKVVKRPLLAMAMVEEEAAVLRICQGHPHVVRLVGSFADARHTAYLVLELLPGGDLFEQVVSRYRSVDGQAAEGYTEDGVRSVMRMALSALEWIHAKRVLHRDLKPENVLLLDRRHGHLDLRVCDFGEALLLPVEGKAPPGGDESKEGSVEDKLVGLVGTRGYMAPEVLEGSRHCFGSDIWSLGVILYILLCGHPPFSADDEAAEADLVLKGRWGFTAPSWRDISPSAKQLISRMLRRDPNSRPSASAALRHDWTSGAASLSHHSRSHQSLSHSSLPHASLPHLLSVPRSLSHAHFYTAAPVSPALSPDTPDTPPVPDASPTQHIGRRITEPAPTPVLDPDAPTHTQNQSTDALPVPSPEADASAPAASVPPAETADTAPPPDIAAPTDSTAPADTVAPPDIAAAAADTASAAATTPASPASLPSDEAPGIPPLEEGGEPRRRSAPPSSSVSLRALSSGYTAGGDAQWPPWQLPPTWAQQRRPWPTIPSWPPQQPAPMFPHIPARGDIAPGGSLPSYTPGGAIIPPGGGESSPGEHWGIVRSSNSLLDVVEALGGYTALRRRDSIAHPALGEGPRQNVPTSYSLPAAAMMGQSAARNGMPRAAQASAADHSACAAFWS